MEKEETLIKELAKPIYDDTLSPLSKQFEKKGSGHELPP